MKAYVFPGQGAQFTGMGKDIYDSNAEAKKLFEKANELLGFNISKVMFEGSDEELKETKITQPAIFLHSVILAKISPDFNPQAVAGHSLGEISALVSANAMSFEDGLLLVSKRAMAMQKACELNPSGMAAVLRLEDEKVEEICKNIEKKTGEIVVPANYNCPGQLVISGSNQAIAIACEELIAAGAKRALILPVGGAFHSPLMEPAAEELNKAIDTTEFKTPICPIYQNVDGLPSSDVNEIKQKLKDQLTSPVRWTQSIQNMGKDGFNEFVECGPGKVLQGLIGKILENVETSSIQQ